MNRVKALMLVLLLGSTMYAAKTKYNNPVIGRSVPDPTVIRAQDGYFYLYGTEDIHNVPIFRSKNLVKWLYAGTAFTDVTRPSMVPGGGIWAPDINYINGKYVMYYSMSVWGGLETCGIGVASADRPEGPFTDHGKLFISKEIGVLNSIDPFYIEDNRHKYLFWGSFRGVYGIELAEDGLSLKQGAQKKQIAGWAIEATYIIKHGNYYYLFGSRGTCCDGANSTYRVVMTRSENLFGPYLDKDGDNILNGYNYSPFLKGNETVAGPGHNSEFIQDATGQYWVLYHGYTKKDPGLGRQVFLDKVYWGVDGWPYIKNGEPSAEEERPVFATTGIDELEETETQSNNISIWPRIVKDNFTITENQSKSFNWSIVSLNGEVIKTGKASASAEIDCYDIPEGMYMVTVTSAKGKSVAKIIKY